MSAPVVRVQRRPIGWLKFRAVCGCGFRTDWRNESDARRAADDHGFDTGHEVWAIVLRGVL